MAEESKVKKCNKDCKTDAGVIQPCNATIPRGSSECPKRKNHMYPFKTGYCDAGFHEGGRAKDASGKPAKVCEFWQFCPCDCHKTIDMLFSLTSRTRTPQENPEYNKPVVTYWMPTEEERVAMLLSKKPGVTVVNANLPKQSVPEPLVVERVFNPTPTGRAARGQLEQWVKQCCEEWSSGDIGYPCTPAYIADWIKHFRDVPNQSVGAIDAVFKRWAEIGYALIEKKPTRFMGFTDEGKKVGLEVLKARAKKSAPSNLDTLKRVLG